MADLAASGLTELLVPLSFGGQEAHIVHESRAVIGTLMEASGASAHFLGSPLQRYKRDVDVISGHVVFDYDTSRELSGACARDMKIPRTAMV